MFAIIGHPTGNPEIKAKCVKEVKLIHRTTTESTDQSNQESAEPFSISTTT